ncbi:unnamed protein product, partial [Mesorhabditis spiculigera]
MLLFFVCFVAGAHAATSWNSVHVAYENWKICLTRNLQVGDVVKVKGTLAAKAVRWTCNIEMESRNGVFIHADHRIAAKSTVYNMKYPGQRWPKEAHFSKVPYKAGQDFEIHFTIKSAKSVEVSYGSGAKWGGALFTKSNTIPNPGLENMRMIRCDGDMSNVMFAGPPVGLCADQLQAAPTSAPTAAPTQAITQTPKNQSGNNMETTTVHGLTEHNNQVGGSSTDLPTTTPANGGGAATTVVNPGGGTPTESPAPPAPCVGYGCAYGR